jgi:sortase A
MPLAIDKRKRMPWGIGVCLVVFVVLLLASLYYLLLVASPTIATLLPQPTQTMTTSVGSINTLYIPKVGLALPYNTGDSSVLDKGAWHRWPERGDPTRGGNFILAGHRFSMGLTPGETIKRSPFYHLDKVEVGDSIYIDYASVRYEYIVARHFTVKPSRSEIEASTGDAKLTLYTCTLAGEADGREVLEATLKQ